MNTLSAVREQLLEMEDERNRERERLWNRSQPRLHRSTSSLSFHSPNERQRHGSISGRPDSAQSFTTPPRGPHSWQSGSAHSSRAGSPASSIASSSREHHSDPRNPVAHERERNWNSPHPKWQHQDPPRSISPLPRSKPGISPSYSRLSNGSPSASQLDRRTSPSGRSRTVSLGSQPARPHSPLVRLGANKDARPASPSSSVGDEPEVSKPPFGSRFGWSFPKNRGSLSPLEYEDSPKRHIATPPGSRPSSRLSNTPSRIPVRSPRRDGAVPTASMFDSSPIHDQRSDEQEDLGGSYVEIHGDSHRPAPRIRIEPVDLIHAETEDLAHTDIEPGECLMHMAQQLAVQKF